MRRELLEDVRAKAIDPSFHFAFAHPEMLGEFRLAVAGDRDRPQDRLGRCSRLCRQRVPVDSVLPDRRQEPIELTRRELLA